MTELRTRTTPSLPSSTDGAVTVEAPVSAESTRDRTAPSLHGPSTLRASAGLVALTLVPAILAVVLALVFAGAQAKRFDADAVFTLADPAAVPQEEGGAADRTPLLTFAQQSLLVASDFQTPTVLTEISKLLGGDPGPGPIKRAIGVVPRGINGVLEVTARAGTAAFAARLANAAVAAEARVGGASIRARYARAAAVDQAGLRADEASGVDQQALANEALLVVQLKQLAAASDPIRLLATAAVPRSPASPKPLRDASLAGGLGLLLGALLAFSQVQLARSGETRLSELRTSGRVLGAVPARLVGAVVRADSDRGSVADREIYRIMRARLDLIGSAPARSVSVSSIRAGAGASGVAASLAVAAAASGRRTLLIDADLAADRAPGAVVHPTGQGLAEVLLGRAGLDDVLQDRSWSSASTPAPRGSLWVLPAGAGARLQSCPLTHFPVAMSKR